MITFKLKKYTDEQGDWLEGSCSTPTNGDRLATAIQLGKTLTDTEVEDKIVQILVNSAKVCRALDWDVLGYEKWLNTGGALYENINREDSVKVYASQKEPLDYEVIRE